MTGGQGGEVNEDGEGAMIQATVTDKSQTDVSIHVFCNCGASALFAMVIVNLDAGP